MKKTKKLTLALLVSLFMFATCLGLLNYVHMANATETTNKMLNWAPENGNYSFGALLEGKGGEGMCLEFDLYDTNFRDAAHLANPENYRVGFEYAKSNLQYFDISGNNLQNCVQFRPDNTFKVVHTDGNPTENSGLEITGEPALFMVKGYRYRVEIRGGAAASLANYFVVSRRPITSSDAEYEQIVAFDLKPGIVADRGEVDPTYAGMIACKNLTMSLDNIYIGRSVNATTNMVRQNFDASDLIFNDGVEVHDETGAGWSGINVYNPSWKAMVGGYGDLNLFYWIDTANVSINETEFALANAPVVNKKVVFKLGTSTLAAVDTYVGGVVKAPALPNGYIWDLNGVDLENITDDTIVNAIADPDFDSENPTNQILHWNPGTNVNAFGARFAGSTGSCVEFDLYDTNFYSLNNGFEDKTAAQRMFMPQIAFCYGRSILRLVDIRGNNVQNVISFFPNGEFNDTTYDGNPVAINPEIVAGDTSLFMQKGYSYRVEMRTSEATELPNNFVVSRKEIAAPASYYEKILNFDLVAPQFERGEVAKTYVAVETRGQVEMKIDNLAFSRNVDDENAKRADFNTGIFDTGTACKDIPEYAKAEQSIIDDGYEGTYGDVTFMYWGNSWYNASERKLLKMPLEHTLTFKVAGEEDQVYKVYNGAIFSGPKAEGYTYTWDTEAAGIDLNNITKSAEINGTKEQSKHTVTFIPGRGTGTMEPLEVVYNTEITLDNSKFTREGYELSGWATSSTGTKVYEPTAKIKVTEDITLYAMWKKLSFTVTFKDGDTVLAEVTVNYGDYVEYPNAAPTKEGYTFNGWDFDLENKSITGNTVINAEFTKDGANNDSGSSGCFSQFDASSIIIFIALTTFAVVMLVKKKFN